MVRIARDTHRVSKFFADRKYGGKRNAQQAAKDFRDRQLAEFERAGIRPRAKRLVSRSSHNKTGLLGIRRFVRKLPDGTERAYYSVSWHPRPGLAAGTTISVSRYGEEKALARAKAIRNKMLMRRYGSGVFRKLKAMRDAHEGKSQQN
jgi:hypothetical protein